jgi:MinD-like ATPase involved in chromosome partitioning or flagellar assembly
MAIITFWNNGSKSSNGQTSSLIATATMMAIEHNYKILIISTKLNNNDIEKSFGLLESNINKFLGLKEVNLISGSEGIVKLAQSGKLKPELIKDYTKIVWKKRLEIIPGLKYTEDIDKKLNIYIEIIKKANQFYDMVFIDSESSLKYDINKKILDISDIIVINTEQKLEKIREIIKEQIKTNIPDVEKTLYLINKYDKRSKYNKKNIERNVKKIKKIYVLPYDYMYSDMIQDGEVSEFFLNPRIRNAKASEEHGDFIAQINIFCDAILNKIKEMNIK